MTLDQLRAQWTGLKDNPLAHTGWFFQPLHNQLAATHFENLLAVAEAFRDFTTDGEGNRIRGSLDRGKAALAALEAAP